MERVTDDVSVFSTTVTLLITSNLLTPFPSVGAADLKTCGVRLQEQQNVTWNATDHTESPTTLRLSYESCLVECGTGMGDVNWRGFSQNFGAWLLPWIALMFQIPFGAERKFHCFALFVPLDNVSCSQSRWMMFFPS